MKKIIDILVDITLVLVFTLLGSGYIEKLPRYNPNVFISSVVVQNNPDFNNSYIFNSKASKKNAGKVYNYPISIISSGNLASLLSYSSGMVFPMQKRTIVGKSHLFEH